MNKKVRFVILNKVKNPVPHLYIKVPSGFFTSFRMTFQILIKKYIFLLGLFICGIIFNTGELFSTPELSLLAGNRCSTCHINYQGSGMRKAFGWTFGKDMTLFLPEDLGLAGVYEFLDKKSYSYFDSLLAFGADFRLQTARSHKTEEAVRRIFPMQASFYLDSRLFNWLELNGAYNFGPKIFPGQEEGSAYVLFKPAAYLPVLKAGYFQPALGMPLCDMTALDRRIAVYYGTQALIPPNYAEYGAELTYEGQNWLTINSGVFMAHSLNELIPYGTGDSTFLRFNDNPSFTFRFAVYPEWLEETLPNAIIGASVMTNDNFWFGSIFADIGILDNLFLSLEYSYSKRGAFPITNNYMAGLAYNPFKGIIIGLRGELGNTKIVPEDQSYDIKFKTTQIVLYSNIFLLPYLEFMPEYRYINCEDYESTRWAAQFHFYY